MATIKHRKNWILTTGQDYMPGGILSLGQVLHDPWNPASALIPGEPTEIPADLKKDDTFKESVDISLNDNLSASFNLWMDAVGGVGEADIGGHTRRSHSAKWEIKRLEGHIFQPSLDYVKEALRAGDVPSRTQWWTLNHRLYLVTGIRIAIGATLNSKDSETAGAHGNVGVDGSSGGIPVRGGIKGHGDAGTSTKLAANKVSDFVFAYRLNEVRWRGTVSHGPYAKGETAAEDDSSHEEVPEINGYELTRIMDEDFDGREGDPFITQALSFEDEEMIHVQK